MELATVKNPIKTKEELAMVLSVGRVEDFCNLWQGADMDLHYKQYEVEGFSHPQQWNSPGTPFNDGSWHTYDGVYSLEDGKISDVMRKAVTRARKEICGDANVWIYREEFSHKEQAFFIYHNGTNGEEGNALNSMKKATAKLELLQSFTSWATLLGVYCDTCDDVYSWYMTFTIE